MADSKATAEAFASDLKLLVEKHFGSISEDQIEPLGMQLRQAMPAVPESSNFSGTLTTVTLYPSLDTDPPD